MDKDQRRKRIGQKIRHIKRQVGFRQTILKDQTNQPHRYAKVSFCTCGNSKCFMCGNPRKVFGDVTIQEKKQRDYTKSFEKETYDEDCE